MERRRNWRMKKHGENKLEVLWSGGYDSTFMLCLLAKTKNVTIQPYYLDIHRYIRNEEKRAIKEIFAILKKKKDLKAKILPVKIVKEEYTQPSNEVIEAWKKYRDEPYKIGGQQVRIAEFSKTHHGICWGQERYLETPGHMTQLLLDKGNWKFTEDWVGYFDKKDCDADVYTLFGHLVAPVAKYTELMMWEKIKEWGYEDVFQHIRFCYYPVDGKSCGMCVPCQVKLRQKMNFLFTNKAIEDGKVMQRLKLQEEKRNGDIFTIPELFMMYNNSVYKKDMVGKRYGGSEYFLREAEKEIEKYRNEFDTLYEK